MRDGAFVTDASACDKHSQLSFKTSNKFCSAFNFESKMSVSVANPRPIDLSAILESQNPIIDLGIKDFEQSSRRFLKAVAAYSSRALDEISQRRSRHAAELKRIAEKKQQVDAEITACKLKEIELMEGEWLFSLQVVVAVRLTDSCSA